QSPAPFRQMVHELHPLLPLDAKSGVAPRDERAEGRRDLRIFLRGWRDPPRAPAQARGAGSPPVAGERKSRLKRKAASKAPPVRGRVCPCAGEGTEARAIDGDLRQRVQQVAHRTRKTIKARFHAARPLV